MTQWQTIDTLPKGWDRILVFGLRETELDFSYGADEKPDVWMCKNEIGNGRFDIAGCVGYSAWVNNPTYWAPVLLPPEPTEQGE